MSSNSVFIARHLLHLVLLIAVSACGGAPPSKAEADTALKEMLKGVPGFQFMFGDAFKNPNMHLVSDLKCDKSGEQHFRCQVLMEKNAATGVQQTIPVEFVKLEGKWRASTAE